MGIDDILKKSVVNQFSVQQDLTIYALVISFVIVAIFGVYIYIIYKFNSKRSFFSPNFAKTLIGLPIITATIIIAMQVNILVSLGMVGALSIVRFRNAVKDPMDLLFLFWSISMGIVCGTGLYILAAISSLVMTIVVFSVDFIPNRSETFLLVIKGDRSLEEENILSVVDSYARKPKVRTRSCKSDRIDLLIELTAKADFKIVDEVMAVEGVMSASLIAHDGEVRY